MYPWRLTKLNELILASCVSFWGIDDFAKPSGWVMKIIKMPVDHQIFKWTYLSYFYLSNPNIFSYFNWYNKIRWNLHRIFEKISDSFQNFLRQILCGLGFIWKADMFKLTWKLMSNIGLTLFEDRKLVFALIRSSCL